MAHSHKGGDVRLSQVAVDLTSSIPTAPINVGDLLFCNVVSSKSYALPITSFTWDTDLATTQAALALLFLGIANGRSRIGVSLTDHPEDANVAVDMDGEIEMDCTSAQYKIGQYVGPAKATGNALLQKVVGVATRDLAIGRVVRNTAASAVRVRVQLINTPIK